MKINRIIHVCLLQTTMYGHIFFANTASIVIRNVRTSFNDSCSCRDVSPGDVTAVLYRDNILFLHVTRISIMAYTTLIIKSEGQGMNKDVKM